MKLSQKFDSKVAFLGIVSVSALMLVSGCQSKVMENREEVPPAERELGFPKDKAIKNLDDQNVKSATPVAFPPMAPMSTDPVIDKKASSSSASSSVAASKEYYVVAKGDSIGSIAQKYKIKSKDLIAVNNITNPNSIRIGQKLKLPANAVLSAKSTKPSSKSTTSVSSSSSSSESSQVNGGLYTVKKNDSVSVIAKRLKVKRADLMAANNLTENSVLRIGQKLVVPGSSLASSSSSTSSSTPSDNASQPTDADFDAITRQLTSETPPTNIKAQGGDKVAPSSTSASETVDTSAPVVLTANISVSDFCKKYNVVLEDLASLNTIPADNIFKSGEVIILP